MASTKKVPEDLGKFESLVDIIAMLRAPDGCPWDRKQTHKSLREHLLEETYEVLEALDKEDAAELCEELGDLLLQIILHAQIASEAGEFRIQDVIRGINTKLIHRHPHIFGSAEAHTAEEVAANWQALKKEERGQETSILAGVPKNMPALAYSQSMQRRAAQVGFDWKDDKGVIEKVAEEVKEFREAQDPVEKGREFGDILFTLVNFARRQGIDAESALRESSERFYKRFTHMEEVCRREGKDLNKCSLDEQNALWESAKEKTG